MHTYSDVLKNYAYHFYPKGIENPFEDEYLSSEEYLTLMYAIDKARDWDFDPLREALMETETEMAHEYQKVADLTNFNFSDRCFHIQYSYHTEDAIKALSVNISVLAPVFCVYYVEQLNLTTEFVGRRITHPQEFHPHDFLKMPDEFKPLKKRLVKLLSDKGYQHIPNKSLNEIIPEISYETIGIDHMTVFNAFFMNEPFCNSM